MIVDVHSHVFDESLHFARRRDPKVIARARPGMKVNLTVRYEEYRATAPPETRTIVFGGKSRNTGMWVDDDYVANYVTQDPERLIGFMSLDPTEPEWYREMRRGHEELGLHGIKLLPMYAGFYPDAPQLEPLWRYAQRNGLPVLLHTGTTFVANAPLRCTYPRHVDEVAIRYPEVKIIMAHLGHPFEGECIAVFRKHPNVFADVSALHYRPFQLYQSLMLVQEYAVWDKVLFGSDYPYTTVNASLRDLRALNEMVAGSNLPTLDVKQLERMIHRDSLSLLGLSDAIDPGAGSTADEGANAHRAERIVQRANA